ncbi:MAG: hypothetical protein Q8Q15_01240 [bacterium]|nr:hypothetical protein [bacterium]
MDQELALKEVKPRSFVARKRSRVFLFLVVLVLFLFVLGWLGLISGWLPVAQKTTLTSQYPPAPESLASQEIVVPTPNPSLPPKFFLTGKVETIDQPSKVIRILEEELTYTIVVDEKTGVFLEPLPLDEDQTPKAATLADVKVGDTLAVAGQDNFAGNTTLKARQIHISQINRILQPKGE